MPHKDPVTPQMHARVLKLDGGCVAPRIDPDQAGKCWGRLTLDHVACRSARGKRARSDEGHLATVCQGHSEDGRMAGHQWNTANRPALRAYLAPRHIPHKEKGDTYP